MNLDELALLVSPQNTTLMLGAGASISSGAPTGQALANMLASRISPTPDGDLSEVCGIFENRLGRKALALAVQERLKDLEPSGDLLALPAYPWKAIYSTNFDRLVEKAYRAAGVELDVCRSNYDFTSHTADSAEAVLYKIHGCISRDVGFGDQARMVLTELDYDEVEQYRQSLFISLKAHMMVGNTLIVGQSLRDPHLRDLAKEVGALRTQGVQGRVLLLAFDYDADRARLFEQRGIEVAPGSLSDLLVRLHDVQPESFRQKSNVGPASPETLPASLSATTTSVSHAINILPDPVRLFNGKPASYSDIHNGITIPRANESRLRTAQEGRRGFFLVISGAAGVGKTSLARRLMYSRHLENFLTWEHQNSYPLDVERWLAVESNLRAANRQGILLIDDCAQHLNLVNKLVDELGKIDRPFLRIVLTVNASQWKIRTKSPFFFSRGTLERLTILADTDIREMVNLVDRKPEIRALVEIDFLQLGHQDKLRRLSERCSAEMFVCLKNIFHTKQLDDILLQEYSDLEIAARDIYRHVSVIQSMGGKVHRQLIMRLLGLEAGAIQSLLGQMDAVVSEYDIRHSEGLYGWSTRHDVIAKVIATYKFADQTELFSLLDRLIDGLNPTIYIELETARSIASNDMGIARLTDRAEQVLLLRKLITVVPAERTPRRRLIRLFLDNGELEEAERAIKVSIKEIGGDSIVDRYQAVLAFRRAESLQGLLEEDRLAMLLEAERLAKQCVSRSPQDRYNYRILADIGVSMVNRFGKFDVLDFTIEAMKAQEVEAVDPDFVRDRRGLESTRRRYV